MDNFDKLHAEQDAFIKSVFHEDKLVSQPVLDSLESYLEKTKIKADKYTHKQKRVILILVILLIISVGYNVYLTVVPGAKKPENKKTINSTTVIIDNQKENDEIDAVIKVEDDKDENTVKPENTTVENTVANENIAVEVEKPTNNVVVANVTKVPTVEKDYSGEIDVEEFTKTLEAYSLGINRIKDDNSNLESNTILLAIAKEHFNSHSNSGLTVDTKYAQTIKNMHTFLSELTGREFNEDYIPSYNNYIGYAQSTKSYLYGKDISILDKEDYKCSDLKISEKSNNGVYSATATITRSLDGVDTVYKVDVDFKVNQNYTYQQFSIISLKAENTSFFPDNTVHFVSN